MLILSKKNQHYSLAAQTRVANELVYVEENDNAIMRRLENVAKSYRAEKFAIRVAIINLSPESP